MSSSPGRNDFYTRCSFCGKHQYEGVRLTESRLLRNLGTGNAPAPAVSSGGGSSVLQFEGKKGLA
jgi:hypothetical protein